MGGAQPLAVTMNDGVALCVDVDPRRVERRLETRYLDEVADSLDDADRPLRPSASDERRPLSVGLVGNAAELLPRSCWSMDFPADIVTDQTSAHDPLSYVPVDLTPEATAELARTAPGRARSAAPRASMATHCRAMVGFLDRGSEVFDYGNSLRTEARLGGFERAFDYPGFLPAYIRPLFCEGKGPFRWVALSGDPADIAATDGPCSRSSPTTRPRPVDPAWPASGSPSRACRRGSAGSATASGTASACASTRWCARGEVSAPIVIGRDHLDSGSVASPYRETEAMVDGSDAIADWPLLNALVNTASGATWVSIHHGGGVGIGRSIHAGMVCRRRRHRPRRGRSWSAC